MINCSNSDFRSWLYTNVQRYGKYSIILYNDCVCDEVIERYNSDIDFIHNEYKYHKIKLSHQNCFAYNFEINWNVLQILSYVCKTIQGLSKWAYCDKKQ